MFYSVPTVLDLGLYFKSVLKTMDKYLTDPLQAYVNNVSLKLPLGWFRLHAPPTTMAGPVTLSFEDN